MQSLEECRKRAARETGAVLLEASRRPRAGERGRSLFFCEPVEWLEAWRPEEVSPLLRRLEEAVAAGLWVAGYLGYECGYALEPRAVSAGVDGAAAAAPEMPLAAFGLYKAPMELAAGLPGGDTQQVVVQRLRLGIDEAAFAEKVGRIREWIASGDTYQVNLTDRFTATVEGEADALFSAMMEAQPVEYGALLRVGDELIVSASPELFFRVRDGRITVRPMKGTAARGRDPAEDDACAAALATDAKNRAENLMIVDLMRSDLGRIAEMGSVRVEELFAVERFPSLLQMTSTVTARLRSGVGLVEVMRSLFPSGSITGAPKVRTMQILRELEGRERGVYTGAIGYWAPSGEAVFSVAIRTAVVRAGVLRMGVGCGITYDSDAAAEYAECRLKGRFLEDGPLRLIETMRCEDGRCALLGLHMDRLERSTGYFEFALERERVEQALQAWAAEQAAGVWKLRVELDRWGRVHRSAPEALVERRVPLRVMLATERVDAGERLLRHKTTRRAVYDRALAEARAAGCDDALLVNERGEVTEGAVHNLVVRHGDAWRTPPVEAGLLPGVFRRHLLETMPQLHEGVLRAAELETADALWLTNAVHGMRAATLVR